LPNGGSTSVIIPQQDVDVLILCGGLGKRLRKVSGCVVPKPMVRVAGKPFLDILLGYFSSFGFRRFILGVGYRQEHIRNYYRLCPKGIDISFSDEKTPLGTGGAVKNARTFIKSKTFFVVNGDSFCDFDPIKFLKFHRENKSLVSILLTKSSAARDYGQIIMNGKQRILVFNEKNRNAKNCFVNAGVYLFERKVYNFMAKEDIFSLEYDFFPKMAGKRIFGFPSPGYFIDIGTPEKYLKAKKYFQMSIKR